MLLHTLILIINQEAVFMGQGKKSQTGMTFSLAIQKCWEADKYESMTKKLCFHANNSSELLTGKKQQQNIKRKGTW